MKTIIAVWKLYMFVISALFTGFYLGKFGYAFYLFLQSNPAK